MRHTCASSYRVIATRRARCCCPFRQQMHLYLCRHTTQIDEIMRNPNISQIIHLRWANQALSQSSCQEIKKPQSQISIHFWTFWLERNTCGSCCSLQASSLVAVASIAAAPPRVAAALSDMLRVALWLLLSRSHRCCLLLCGCCIGSCCLSSRGCCLLLCCC